VRRKICAELSPFHVAEVFLDFVKAQSFLPKPKALLRHTALLWYAEHGDWGDSRMNYRQNLLARSVMCVSLMLMVLLVFVVANAGAMEADERIDASGQWTYILADGGAMITGCVGEPIGDLVIPGELDGHAVTTFGDYALAGWESLTSVVIPDGVTGISNRLFYQCDTLTSVIIPNSVTVIGDAAFGWSSALTGVTIPDSVTHIGDSAFSMSALTSIIIPDSVEHIGDYAFGMSDIESVIIPNRVKRISEGMFDHCGALTSVTIGESVEDIGDGAFKECVGLSTVIIPDSVTSIGHSAFIMCDNLTSVTIPASVTEIGESVFWACESLILSVKKGSYAEQYAEDSDIAYVFIE
jgi:hypothetical protein